MPILYIYRYIYLYIYIPICLYIYVGLYYISQNQRDTIFLTSQKEAIPGRHKIPRIFTTLVYHLSVNESASELQTGVIIYCRN